MCEFITTEQQNALNTIVYACLCNWLCNLSEDPCADAFGSMPADWRWTVRSRCAKAPRGAGGPRGASARGE